MQNVKPDLKKFDQAVKKIAGDARYKVLKSKGEKVQAFNEWCQQKAKQLKVSPCSFDKLLIFSTCWSSGGSPVASHQGS